MVDIPSDLSSAGSAADKLPPRVQVHVSDTSPIEKNPQSNGYVFAERKVSQMEDDEEEEDVDALIEELESLDPDAELEAEIEIVGGARTVPEEMLQTDTRVGLIEPEVVARRKKYGLNQMREEKENLFLKFLRYFVGPIQFVMEV
jgi:H+-transporting ATPase